MTYGEKEIVQLFVVIVCASALCGVAFGIWQESVSAGVFMFVAAMIAQSARGER